MSLTEACKSPHPPSQPVQESLSREHFEEDQQVQPDTTTITIITLSSHQQQFEENTNSPVSSPRPVTTTARRNNRRTTTGRKNINKQLFSGSNANSSPSSSTTSSPTPTKVVRDEKRRANHNEVERRRRDNINKWIVELSKIIPDCSNQPKHGQVVVDRSKGGILEKTLQYICELKEANEILTKKLRNYERLKLESDQQNEKGSCVL